MSKNLQILRPNAAAKHLSDLDKGMKKAEKAKLLLQARCTHTAPAGEKQFTRNVSNTEVVCTACNAKINFATFDDADKFNECIEYIINVINIDKILLAQNLIRVKDKDTEKLLETLVATTEAMRSTQKTHKWILNAHSEKNKRRNNENRSQVSWGSSTQRNDVY